MGVQASLTNPLVASHKLVTVTAAGRTATDAHIDAHKAVMRDHVARLTAAEADRLAAALHPLLSSRTTEQETPA